MFSFGLCAALSVLVAIGTRAQTEPEKRLDSVEVLSDRQGVDFGPYLQDVARTVRTNWHRAVPERVEAPVRQKGKVTIEFSVKRDGKVAGMKLAESSGNVPLDRAAWAGIFASDPLPPLPVEFKGEYLALRFRFYYFPDKADLVDLDAPTHASPILHAKLMTSDPDSRLPKYPKKARQDKTEGLVRLDVDVGADGKVKDLKVLEGDPLLADASVRAVRKWRFYAAEKDGKPVEERTGINVDFQLGGKQVRAQVVSDSETSPSPAR
jgi:TonB family protein